MPLLQLLAITYGLLTLVGCASSTRPDLTLHDGPEGGVYLERIADSMIQASHPIKLDSKLVARILNGVQVGEPRTAAHTLFASQAKPERVFSDEDTAFLAPLISSALAQATAAQQVRFRVVHPSSPIALPTGGGAGVGSFATPSGGPQKETTEGTLYAHGRSLHFTLDEYRHRAVKPDVISGPNRYYPDPTGLREREVRFAPASALRSDRYKQSDGNTIVIDYELLTKDPSSEVEASGFTPTPLSARQEQPASAEDQPTSSNPKTDASIEEAQALKDLVIKKDLELENLKKELKSLRRQLSERDAQGDGTRKKSKPTTKAPDPLP